MVGESFLIVRVRKGEREVSKTAFNAGFILRKMLESSATLKGLKLLQKEITGRRSKFTMLFLFCLFCGSTVKEDFYLLSELQLQLDSPYIAHSSHCGRH